MRWPLLFVLVVGGLLLAGGLRLAARAPDLVQTESLQRLGERWDWSGMYVTTTEGCFFVPDYDVWEGRVRITGRVVALLGAGLAGACAWDLARRGLSKPRGAQPAGETLRR